MVEEIIKTVSQEAEKILSRYKEEIASLRTSRATPALVENVLVESYGSTLPLKQLASLTVNQPNVIVVQPWDKSILSQIEKSLRDSNIGISPIVEGEIIRLTLPPLTEERRKELLKLLGKKTEEARINFRLARDEARKKIHDLSAERKITEDDKYRANEKLQKEVEKFNSALEDLAKRKEAEIMQV
jgi:ribosome recycling factor